VNSRYITPSAALAIALLCHAVPAADESKLGAFDDQADVGKVDPPGSAQFDKASGAYRITSAGQNVWGAHDDFHFLHRRAAADFVVTADVSFVGDGRNAHRKAGGMLRQGLEPDAPYADVVVHGDGLISLQYREKPGGPTLEIKSELKAKAVTVRLERRGDTVTAAVAVRDVDKDAQPTFKPIGSVQLPLRDPAYAGLFVCSHEAAAQETAVFSRVTFEPLAQRPPAQK
jgi:regulation of enolase protein 1 (concanavalin A-like superfamily)